MCVEGTEGDGRGGDGGVSAQPELVECEAMYVWFLFLFSSSSILVRVRIKRTLLTVNLCIDSFLWVLNLFAKHDFAYDFYA